jgi:ketosteroid isomerase-like protein
MTRGKRAFEETYRSRVAEHSGGTHSNALVEYSVEGDLAYQVGTFAITGSESPEQGKFLNVLERQPDATWKVAVSIFNSDKP